MEDGTVRFTACILDILLSIMSEILFTKMAGIFLSSTSSLYCNDTSDALCDGPATGFIGRALELFTSLLDFFEEKCNKIDPFTGELFFSFFFVWADSN